MREYKNNGVCVDQRDWGIAAAKARGVNFGRPEEKVPKDFETVIMSWERKEIEMIEVLKLCDMSASTFYRRLSEIRSSRKG